MEAIRCAQLSKTFGDALALTLRAPGAFPSYWGTRIARSAPQREYILPTLHQADRAFGACQLAKGVFHAVGAAAYADR
jgi:hypothetical protein